jgi:molecular chaperone GrpE
MSRNEKEVTEELEAADSADAEGAEPAFEQEPSDAVQLTTMLEDARSKADENWNQCLRLQAEIENLRKRTERDLANAHKYALERFALELLPVRDSLEMGLSAASAEEVEAEKLKEGVELTLQMLSAALEKFAIREIDPQDERFNPDFHQAMSMQERGDVEPNTVVTVVQKGYLLNDRLLRPAMVIVSSAPQAPESR